MKSRSTSKGVISMISSFELLQNVIRITAIIGFKVSITSRLDSGQIEKLVNSTAFWVEKLQR